MESTGHTDDYNGSFKDTVWLQSFPLTIQTALHYFALSPFYDRNCNNERLKMQRLELDRLKTMRGLEYEAIPMAANMKQPSLFIIRKQRRTSPHDVQTLAVYYILDGTIYQAPNIRSMLMSRIKKCSFRVNEAFLQLAKGVQHSPTEGYAWDFSTEETKQRVIPSEQLNQRLKKQMEEREEKKKNGARIENIVLGLLKKYLPDVVEAGQAEAAAKAEAETKNGVKVEIRNDLDETGPSTKRQKVN